MPFLDGVLALIWMLFSLGIVLVTAYIVLKYIGKRGMGASGTTSAIKVLERVAVGKDQSILLVSAGSKTFLVAFATHGATVLCEYDKDDAPKITPSAVPNFSIALKGALDKWHLGGSKKGGKPDE